MGKPKGESRGLAFLGQARPDATRHLMSFFRESGRHLEPKTRFLISIVTKVINLSPRGVEQYVKRALDAGATPDEIVDAILCSYPCAGLTRVVDALDVILDLDLPGFAELAHAAEAAETATAPAAPPAGGVGARTEVSEQPVSLADDREPTEVDSVPAPDWIEIGRLDELDGGRLEVRAADRDLAVFVVDGEVRVIDNLCPHRGAPLAGGTVDDGVVTCPLHRWQFDLATGVSPDHPGAQVGTYEVRVEDDGRILAHI